MVFGSSNDKDKAAGADQGTTGGAGIEVGDR